jgi:hypothetical protein
MMTTIVMQLTQSTYICLALINKHWKNYLTLYSPDTEPLQVCRLRAVVAAVTMVRLKVRRQKMVRQNRHRGTQWKLTKDIKTRQTVWRVWEVLKPFSQALKLLRCTNGT